MTQKERQERSRKEIFQAALEEFGTHGYDNVTMDSICSRHGISKGMMYHYYSNKDELFLLCVQDTFQALKAQIERDAAELSGQSSFDSIKNYLLIREYFFQLHPKRKLIFENAMLRPPKQLTGQIRALHAPLKEMNRQFMGRVVSHMSLREGLDRELKYTTRLIVAQRIGTIRNADKIIVLDEGKAVGIGTHDELMQTCPVYQEIARSQLSEEELGTSERRNA